MNSIPLEIERKFLISYPNEVFSLENVKKKDMIQTYLLSENGETDRVRKLECDGKIKYIRTQKRRINALSCFENENEISFEEYEKLLERADKALSPIIKTRYSFPYEGHIIEIDIYPFWNDRAILEIEMKEETEICKIPEFITVIKEVTEDKRYKNVNLAKSVVFDDI